MTLTLPRVLPSPPGKHIQPPDTTGPLRGGPFPARSVAPCLELGSGPGAYTPLLADAFGRVVSLDISANMLRQAAGRSPSRIRADAAAC